MLARFPVDMNAPLPRLVTLLPSANDTVSRLLQSRNA